MRTLDDQLCFALYSATTGIVRAYRPRLQRLGLTYPQYLVLLALWQHGPLRVGELAGHLALPAHGLAPVLRRLDAAGLVVRVPEAGDRRAVRVELTGAGRALREPALAAQREVVCETGLQPAQLAELREALRVLAGRLADPRPARPARARAPRPARHVRPAPVNREERP